MDEVNQQKASYKLTEGDARRIKDALTSSVLGACASAQPRLSVASLSSDLIEAFRRVDEATMKPASAVTADGSPCPSRVS